MNRARVQSLPHTQRQEHAPLPSQYVSSAVKQRLKRRAKWRKLFLCGFAAWAAYVIVFVQMPSLHRLDQQQQTLNAQIAQVNKSNQNLQQEIKKLDDPNYIAEIAREKYLMVKDGETLFVDPKPQP